MSLSLAPNQSKLALVLTAAVKSARPRPPATQPATSRLLESLVCFQTRRNTFAPRSHPARA